jgi:hypothetical protein
MFDRIKQYYHKLAPALEHEQWIAIEQRFTVQQLKKGDYLTRQGEVCRQVSFINNGLLRFL